MEAVSNRQAWVDVDLDAITTNTSLMAAEFAPAALCVAVKANGYGHGMVPVAKAALAGGARGLAVALIDEAIELRQAGIDVPILVLFEPGSDFMDQVVQAKLTPVLYSYEGARAFSKAVADAGVHPQPVHVKIDTGMHRTGALPSMFFDLCKQISDDENMFVEGVMTHFAVADDPDDPFTGLQARRFRQTLNAVFPQSPPPFAHCCNSAAALLYPSLRMDMVRIGIALYGQPPSRKVPLLDGMRSAMSVRALVGSVRDIAAGEAVGYGQHYVLDRPSRIASITIGYGDGIQRSLWKSGEVLIGGKRRKMAGTISMDQITVDCGDDRSVQPGDEVVILGRQGTEEITATDIADQLDTINYEIVTRMGARLPRRFLQGGAAVDLRQQRIATSDDMKV